MATHTFGPFRCPRCQATSSRNSLGDIDDQQVAHGHQFLSTLGYRICVASFKSGGQRLGVFKSDYEDIRI